MPQSITTFAEIKTQCQNEIGDTSTDILSSSEFASLINDVTKEILDDCINVQAVPLYDYLLDKIELTLTADDETVDYLTQITNESKSYYRFHKATWSDGDYPWPVRVLSNKRYWEAKCQLLNPSSATPYMTFSTNGTLLLQPTPTSSTTSGFYFYWIKPPTAMSADGDKSDLSEPCIKLYKYLVAAHYFRRRGNYNMALFEEKKYDREKKRVIGPYKSSSIYRIMTTTKD